MADGEGDFVYSRRRGLRRPSPPVSLGDVVGKVSVVLSGLEPGERIVLLGPQSVVPEGKVVRRGDEREGREDARPSWPRSPISISRRWRTASPDRQAKDVAGGSN
jgi:hypothetical protein